MAQGLEKPRTEAILNAIIITIGFSVGFVALWYYVHPGEGFSIRSALWMAPAYWIGHIVAGRLVAAMTEGLCNVLDLVYGLDAKPRWGRWTATGRLYFASLWPIAGTIVIPTASIGILFGLLFKLF
jgi:hypothetical protein